jgi:protoporphyrinogen oxidase
MVQGNLKRGYNNFHEWIYVSFGKGIARHFMLPYNEKFWTAPLSDITCQWLDGFVPVLTFNDIVNKSSRYLRSLGYNTYFYYPESAGIEELPFALGEYIKSDISLRSEVTGIDIKNRTVMINNRQIVHYSNLVSTLPLPELKNIIKDIPKKISNFIDVLNYNSIVVFNIGVKAMLHHIDKHWIYFPEKKNRYFRVGFYSSFSKALTPPLCSSMYAEVSYHKDKRINMAELEKEVISDLSREGIISSPKDVVCNNIINIKYGYPIYDQNYSVAVSNILKFLSSYGIYSIGRYGRWKYMTMEDVLMDGEKTAGVF